MPARSIIDQLPPELREWLEAELVRRGFADYIELTEELNRRIAGAGLEVTVAKSSVHRYGAQVGERIAALKRSTEVARTLAREVGDDEGAMNDALMRLVQDRLFNVVLDLELDPAKINFLKLGHLVADLGRASVTQKKHQVELRARAKAAAAVVAETARKGGLSDDAIELIRREILGIADAS